MILKLHTQMARIKRKYSVGGISLLLYFIAIPLWAQTPVNKVWDCTIGGADADNMNILISTPDGGYLMGGTSSSGYSGNKTQISKGGTDYWVVRVNSNGGIIWNKTFGGSGTDYLSSLAITSDGGFLLGGTSSSETGGDKTEASRGGSDFWVVKITAEGSKVWDKTFGGNGSDNLNSLVSSPEGGFLLGGDSDSGISGDKTEESRGEADFWVIKLNADGGKVWDRRYGGFGDDYLTTLKVVPGGYLLGGLSNSSGSYEKASPRKGYFDFWVLQIGGDGSRGWNETYGGLGLDVLLDIVPVEGGYLLGGYSNSSNTLPPSGDPIDKTEPSRGSDDFWVVKVDSNGRKIWDRTFGGSESERISAMIPTSDGGYLLGGYSSSLVGGDKTAPLKGGSDTWVVKITSGGTKIWDKSFGGNASDGISSIVKASDGGYIVGGSSSSEVSDDKSQNSKGSSDFWLMKLEETTTTQVIPVQKSWNKTLGGSKSDLLVSLTQASDGGFLLGGYSYSDADGDRTEISKGGSDYWVVKLNSDGSKAWDKSLGGIGQYPFQFQDELRSIIATKDGGFLLAGTSDSGIGGDRTIASRGDEDYWVVKLNADGSKAWDNAYGGGGYDVLYSAFATDDGGFLLAGVSHAGQGGDKTVDLKGEWRLSDYWVVKISADGVKEWDRAYGGNYHDFLTKVISTSDGGLLFLGSGFGPGGDKTSPGDGSWLLKINPDGSKAWDKEASAYGLVTYNNLSATPDGGFILWGTATDGAGSKGGSDYGAMKVNAAGNKEWERRYGGLSNDYLESMVAAKEGGYLMGGWSYSSANGDKSASFAGYWMLKIAFDGNIVWERTVQGNSDVVTTSSLIETTDGGYLLGGSSASVITDLKTEESKGESDYWVLKLEGGSETPLPVSWLSFEGEPRLEGNELTWSTASEINTESFLVERSMDGKTFYGIGKVPAAGNSSQLERYSFLDTQLSGEASTQYYRLKQLDLDGKMEYSKTIVVSRKGQKNEHSLLVYPNPFVNNLKIRLNSPVVAKEGQILLIATDGREVYRRDISSLLGARDVVLDELPELTTGVYLLQVILDGRTTVLKLIRQ